MARSETRNRKPLNKNKMEKLTDYQAHRIEALEKRVKELEEKLLKYIEVNEPIILPNL